MSHGRHIDLYKVLVPTKEPDAFILRNEAYRVGECAVSNIRDWGFSSRIVKEKTHAYGPQNGFYVLTVSIQCSTGEIATFLEEESALPDSCYHKLYKAPSWVRKLTETEPLI